MYNIKEYIKNYDKSEFYGIMGKFFAERTYRKLMPYLINDEKKEWYLFFDKQELAGFCGIKNGVDFIELTDIYSVEKYYKLGILEFMCKKIFATYKKNNIKVLTDNEKEINIWHELGFEIDGKKGRYTILTWENKNE